LLLPRVHRSALHDLSFSATASSRLIYPALASALLSKRTHLLPYHGLCHASLTSVRGRCSIRSCFQLIRYTLCPRFRFIFQHLFHYRGSQAGLSHGSLWSKLGRSPGGMKKEPDLRQQQAQLALTRQRLLTLCFGEMETVRLVCSFCFVFGNRCSL
jgi:hypothetical protein